MDSLPAGVVLTKLEGHSDPRGNYLKFFDSEKLEKFGINKSFSPSEAAIVTSNEGAKRGLKLDEGAPEKLAFLFSGKLEVKLIDQRNEDNLEFVFEMESGKEDLLFIPKGVVWGNTALQNSIIVYCTAHT